MPELPEVETVRIGLARLLPGRQVKAVSFDTPKSFPNAETDVQRFLIGAKIVAVKRRAKVLLIELDTKYTLVVHLKMTGQLVFVSDKTRFGAGHPSDSLINQLPDKSTRVILDLADSITSKESVSEPSARKNRSAQQSVPFVHGASTGESDTAIVQKRWRSFELRPKAGQRGTALCSLYFNDQRKFGWMRLIPTAEVPNIDFFKKVGPEPLSADFTWQILRERLARRKRTNIKAALLDQTVLAGVGNIYADEALWGAKVHPKTLVQDLADEQIKAIHVALIAVLKLSIEKGGSSNHTYVDAEGKKGSYMSFANVFRREGQPCLRCGTTIIKTRVAGRGTHVCPFCQKEPK